MKGRYSEIPVVRFCEQPQDTEPSVPCPGADHAWRGWSRGFSKRLKPPGEAFHPDPLPRGNQPGNIPVDYPLSCPRLPFL